MRLFICEYVTGGGYAAGPLPEGLVREGERMLRALLSDARAAGVEVLTTRDARLPAGDLDAEVRTIPAGADAWATWERAIADVDAVWPVAPETGGLLERLSAMALAAGRTLIGSRPAAVRLAASKRATARALTAAGLSVVPTLADASGPTPSGWVVKPDDGAGSEWTRRCVTRAEVLRAMSLTPDALLQPYLPGDATSLAMLCRDGRAWLLSCNSQVVGADGDRLHYRGGIVGGREDRRAAYAGIAAGVAEAIPGLWGYVGVDLIESARGPVVVEVNPRISVPYAGLRAALGLNPAELILRLADEGLPAIERTLTVRPTPVMLDA